MLIGNRENRGRQSQFVYQSILLNDELGTEPTMCIDPHLVWGSNVMSKFTLNYCAIEL